jgi:hypothetical protein
MELGLGVLGHDRASGSFRAWPDYGIDPLSGFFFQLGHGLAERSGILAQMTQFAFGTFQSVEKWFHAGIVHAR